ncbi:Hypothetical predicted protein, partial [Scomber scombrus]
MDRSLEELTSRRFGDTSLVQPGSLPGHADGRTSTQSEGSAGRVAQLHGQFWRHQRICRNLKNAGNQQTGVVRRSRSLEGTLVDLPTKRCIGRWEMT